MADLTRADSIANRDDPIPIIRIPSHEEAVDFVASASESDYSTKSSRGKSPRREQLKQKARDVKEKVGEYVEGTPEVRQSIQDRLFASLLSQIIPVDDEGGQDGVEGKGKSKVDRRSRKYVERPNFSVGMMSTNFRRFNARIGIAFVLENRLIHLFSWQHTTATLSFLAVYSLLCLNPRLLPLVPLVGVLFIIMIPSYIARHPILNNDPMMTSNLRGPATAPPSRVKPAPEMSKDFFRNMRDLQNTMEDFSRLHDAANDYITPYTNFSDEALSSTLFLFLFTFSIIVFVGSHLIPWRFLALLAGWAATLMCRERVSSFVLSRRNLRQFRSHLSTLRTALRNWIEKDILFDDPPERRQVEVFELHKYHAPSLTWEPWLFSPSPWDPLSPARISGSRPRGTQFFEDVQAPSGWDWRDKKWTLDLFSREWVEQRMISGVEIETEGERWVYDLPEETVREIAGSPKKKSRDVPKSGWEEGTGINDRGEWRRRRWVRLVEKKVVGTSSSKGSG